MNILKAIQQAVTQLANIREEISLLKQSLHKLQEGVGRIEARQLVNKEVTLASHEFRAFSQWGEDGIIQYLIQHVDIPREIFVEFGVQDYTESNTRFLLTNNNWAGLVIDGEKEYIDFIKNDQIYWQHNLKAVHGFITRNNINELIAENGINGEIGLLSIDIDGNDYWVWEAINIINPAIVITEYNHRFGLDKAVSIPYNEHFTREKAHYSMIYYGASLKALYLLGQRKGYVFVGCNSAGNNAFFIRKDLLPVGFKELTAEEGFVAGKFRESRDESGNLQFLEPEEELKLLASLPLVEVS
jgi:hypothetical protein